MASVTKLVDVETPLSTVYNQRPNSRTSSFHGRRRPDHRDRAILPIMRRQVSGLFIGAEPPLRLRHRSAPGRVRTSNGVSAPCCAPVQQEIVAMFRVCTAPIRRPGSINTPI